MRPTILVDRHSERQDDLLDRCDRLGAQADQLLLRAWDNLFRSARRPPVSALVLQQKAALIWAKLLHGLAARMASGLAALAVQGHRSATRALRDVLSTHLTEDEAAPSVPVFAPLTLDQVLAILRQPIQGRSWEQDLSQATRLATPDWIGSVLAFGFAAGQTPQEVARTLRPVVAGVQVTAKRIARTYGMQVAHSAQMQAHEQLGDLVIGYQVHATKDVNTRPEHRARDGTIYYREPSRGQKGLDECPHPPLEADGTMAWNCRCWLSPVLRP